VFNEGGAAREGGEDVDDRRAQAQVESGHDQFVCLITPKVTCHRALVNCLENHFPVEPPEPVKPPREAPLIPPPLEPHQTTSHQQRARCTFPMSLSVVTAHPPAVTNR